MFNSKKMKYVIAIGYGCYLQREVVVVAYETSRLYKEKTPIKKQSVKGEWEEKAKGTPVIVRLFAKKNDKMLAVADPANEDDFMVEVCSYANFSKIVVICFNSF